MVLNYFEAIKRIDEDIPVIILSEYGSVESAIASMHKGAFDYITKPFRKEQILYSIDNALKLRRFQRENRIFKKRLNNEKGLILDHEHLALQA